MNKKNSIIDVKRLELILKFCSPKESNKLNKRLNNLFKGFSKESLKLVTLLERFNNPNFNSDLLEPYTIGQRKIYIIRKPAQVKKAVRELLKSEIIGFDTEQRPTFKKGEKQKEISIIQMATKEGCYIFQMCFIQDKSSIIEIIANKGIKKVGFDLRNDYKELTKQFGIQPQNIFDLSPFMKNELRHKNQIGVKNSVSLILLKKMQKSKKVALTNWENDNLTEQQIKYASEDATAPFDIYESININFPSILKNI